MRVYYEPLIWAHLVEAQELPWGGFEGWSINRLRYLPIIGYAARSEADDSLQGTGCVAFVGGRWSGHAQGCFGISEALRASPHSRWVHRRALEVLALAHRTTPTVLAYVDPDIPNAREFVSRLGFVEEQESWVHYGIHDPGSGASRVVRDGERGVD